MNQEEIGRFICEMRKIKKMTQMELASELGVTDKAISKWENGRCLPDVSLFKRLCEVLDISLNELFAAKKIGEKEYKKIADENLYNALENSVFTIKERLEYFKKKWQKEHAFELTIKMLLIILFIIISFVKDLGFQYIAIILGFVIAVSENNRMMAYIENHVYGSKTDISLNEIKNDIEKLKKLKQILKRFKTRDEACQYLTREIGLSYDNCLKLYDSIINLKL